MKRFVICMLILFLMAPMTVYASSEPTGYYAMFNGFQISSGSMLKFPTTRVVEVFPKSIEIAESGSATNEIRPGNAYVLHYEYTMPLYFYYPGHKGTASSEHLFRYWYQIDYNGASAYPIYTMSGMVTDYDADFVASRYEDNVTYSDGYSAITGSSGVYLKHVPIVDNYSLSDVDITLSWDVVMVSNSNPLVMNNAIHYACDLYISEAGLYQTYFTHLSDQSSDVAVLEEIKQNQEEQHQEEKDMANDAVNEMNSAVTELTGTLNTWQIVTMPMTLLNQFAEGIAADGSTGFTFPSFELMGHQIWPSYTFDLDVIKENFPVLINALHTISGILIVIAFVRYINRKYSIIFGDKE